ncbi:MAG: DUF3817 domain-containing protein [Verrucomicrobiota bacterium]
MIATLRTLSILDALSYLVLLFVAMPLKYLAEIPIAVSITGLIHGILFVGLCLMLLVVLILRKLPFLWCLITFICSVIPFAPFFLDKKLKTFS